MKFHGCIIFITYERKRLRVFKKKTQNPATLETYIKYIENIKAEYGDALAKVYIVKTADEVEYVWCSDNWRDYLSKVISPNHQKYLNFLQEQRTDLTFIGPYRSKRSKDFHLCKFGHEWKVAPIDIMKGATCPYCSRKNRESKGAKLITELLATRNIEFIKEVSLKRFSFDRDLRFDFLICKNNFPLFAIEYHGIQHYKNLKSKHFGGPTAFKDRKDRDNDKREVAEQNGLPLLEIPYKYTNEQIEVEVQKYLHLFELA